MSTGELLRDKVAVITGGAGSIGLAMARLFVAQGARVMLADHDQDRLASAVAGWETERVAWAPVDVRQGAAVRQLMERTIARFGALDVVCSNAGSIGPIAPLAEYPDDGFADVLAVHVNGAFLCCKHALPHLRPGGSIILTSSVAGVRGDPGPYGYIAAKHAQVGLMRAVAKEAAARGIRVNTLHPGPIANDFQREVEAHLTPVLRRDAGEFFDQAIPLGRHGEPAEVAQAALFLASGMSSFVTGSILMVDGGMTA